MNTQFWWFYDLVTAAIFLLVIYLAAKKGFSKVIYSAIAAAVSFVLALSLSGSLATAIWKVSINSFAHRDLTRIIEDYDFPAKVKSQMEGLNYKLRLDIDFVTKILNEDYDVYEGLYKYANSVNNVVVDERDRFDEEMNKMFLVIFKDMLAFRPLSTGSYTTVPQFAVNGLDYSKSNFGNYNALISTVMNNREENPSAAADYIVNNHFKEPSVTVFRLISFAAIYFISTLFLSMFVAKMFESTDKLPDMGILERPVGAVFGLVQFVGIMFAVAATVGFFIHVGNNEMTLYNEETVQASYLFKLIYNIKFLK